jgi:hypothetical protein
MQSGLGKVPKSTIRYRNDEEYRKRVIARTRKKHLDNMLYPVYAKLHRVRVAICNYKGSIEYHKSKVKMFEMRIARAIITKERLEIEWGKIRAERKRRRNGF